MEEGKIVKNENAQDLPLKGQVLTTTAGKPARNTMLDMVRILAMFFIIIHHILIYDMGFMNVQEGIEASLKATYMSAALVDCFVIIGVNIFFLISGYFSTKLQPKKLLLLLIKVYIYWIVSTLLAMACKLISFSSFLDGLKYIVSGAGEYWFILVYVLLCLAAPALNAFAKLVVEKKAEKYFIFITVFFFCIIGFAADYVRPIMGTNSGYSVMWAAIPYLYGRIFKLKGIDGKKRKPGFWFLLYVIFAVLNYAIIAPLIWFEKGQFAWHFYGYNNPIIFLQSICLFMAFLSSKPVKNAKVSKLITIVAGHTFAVYLLHTKNPLISPFTAFIVNNVDPLWAKILVLIPNAIIVLIVTVLIDIVYELLLGKLLSKFTAWLERLIFGKSKILEKLNGQSTPQPVNNVQVDTQKNNLQDDNGSQIEDTTSQEKTSQSDESKKD